MNRKTNFPSKLFSGALHAAALAILVIDNFNKLWLCILFFSSFLFISLLQNEFGTAEKGRSTFYPVFILIKFGLSVACAALLQGLGATLLFCILVLDICYAWPPLPSGIMSVVALGTLLALSPGNQEAVILQIVLLFAIYLLAHTIKSEQTMSKSMAETISALRVSQKALLDKNYQIQQLTGTLEEAAMLKERSRITKGIHDTLGQTLTAIVVQLSAALQVIDRDNAARENILNACDQAKRGLGSVRETIHMLDDTGTSFAGKLKQAIEAAEANLQIKVLPVVDTTAEPDGNIQQVLLSCLREGLTNGVRHGGATAFVLKLETADGQVRLYLEDNGRGCATLTKGYGLTAMEEMVEQSGGTFEASAMLDEGFYLKISLPSGTGNGE